MREFSKIFGIGLSKTGTMSLQKALIILGIKSIHNAKKVTKYLEKNRKHGDKLLSSLDRYDGFTDHPIPDYMRELDHSYPDSLFILTTRNVHDWVVSKYKHWTWRDDDKKEHPFEVKEQLQWYHNWTRRVLDYFQGRDNDLLILRICEGEGWEKLCSFLETEIPDEPFPYANTSREDDFYDGIEEIKRELNEIRPEDK